MSKVEIKCEVCGSLFERSKKEYNRSIKLGRRMFCSRKCCGKGVGENLGKHLGGGNSNGLRANNRQDEYSPFRYFLRKARNRKYEHNLDLEYLKQLWEEQSGLCAISGIEMHLPKNTSQWEKDTRNPWKTSLDRIDSSIGYFKGNVRYICNIGNQCKYIWNDEAVIKFCKAVSKNNS